jgi:hypothetical protein
MLTIYTNGSISIDGRDTGLSVRQVQGGTTVYTREDALAGTKYRKHPMPQTRYSTAHDAPASGAAGRVQFEADIRALLAAL